MTIDEKVQALLEMGFGDEGNVRRQLTRAKNDMNVAVAYLTDDDGVGWAIPSTTSRPSETALAAYSESK